MLPMPYGLYKRTFIFNAANVRSPPFLLHRGHAFQVTMGRKPVFPGVPAHPAAYLSSIQHRAPFQLLGPVEHPLDHA